jgi:hypothetical protein
MAPAVAGGTLDAAYSPPLQLGGTPIESRSTQTLSIDTGVGEGINAGANLFFNRVVGLQAAFTWARADVGGANASYDVHLRCISRPPPDYVPQEVSLDRSDPWMATEGMLRYRSIALGGVLRWRASRDRVGGTVAGGVNFARYSGDIVSFAYTQFILGGHSTLFSTRHRAVMALADAKIFERPYVGGDVHTMVSRRVAVLGGVRLVLGPRLSVSTRFERLVDPNEDTWTPTDADAAERLGIQPLSLSGIRWQVVVGLKVFVP